MSSASSVRRDTVADMRRLLTMAGDALADWQRYQTAQDGYGLIAPPTIRACERLTVGMDHLRATVAELHEHY